MVNAQSITWITFTLIVSIGLPVAFLGYFGLRRKVKILSVVSGISVFIVFSMVLESLVNFAVSTTGLFGNPWLYSIYGGVAAGVFEEGGRFLAFLFVLKELQEWKDGIAYGIGHGGTQAVILGGFGSINYLSYIGVIDGGAFAKVVAGAGPSQASSLNALKDFLVNTSPVYFAIEGFARMAAFMLQLALSLLVLYAVTHRRYIFVLYAALIHAVSDFFLYQKGILNMWVVAAFSVVIGVGSIMFLIYSKDKLFSEPEEDTEISGASDRYWKRHGSNTR